MSKEVTVHRALKSTSFAQGRGPSQRSALSNSETAVQASTGVIHPALAMAISRPVVLIVHTLAGGLVAVL